MPNPEVIAGVFLRVCTSSISPFSVNFIEHSYYPEGDKRERSRRKING
jgi:hypothetical protein